MLKRVIASLLLASMVACTTLKPVADYRLYVRNERPNRLWVLPSNSSPVIVEGPRFVNDTLVGFVKGRYREFAPGQIQRVQIRQPATQRTALLVGVGVTLGIVAIALLASGGPTTYIPTPEDPPTSRYPRLP